MKNIDVLLINVPTSRRYKKDLVNIVSMPPLGLMYISSNLMKYGYTAEILDMSVEFYNKEEFIEKILTINPKIIGISTFVESWSAMKVVAKIIKETLPEVPIVGGGACASFCYEQILHELKFDYIVFGEGENTFVNLCDSLINKRRVIHEVDGIAYLKDGNIKITKANTRIKNLDDLPFPSRDLIRMDRYIYPVTISTSRGCPGKCIFCSSRSYWGKEICFRNPENVVAEILEVEKKYNTNMFFIIDDTFTISPNRAIKFCELLINSGKNFIWGCESRADVVSEKLLRTIYEAGCRKIQFGMESGNDEILNKIGKKVTTEQIQNAVKLASSIGFDINVSFIIGHPFDTHETVKQTIDMALRLKDLYHANVFGSINTPYPGTDLYNNAGAYGIELLTKNWDKYTMDNAIINTKNLTAEEIRHYYQDFVNTLLGKTV